MASLLKRKVPFYGQENNNVATANDGLSVSHFLITQNHDKFLEKGILEQMHQVVLFADTCGSVSIH